jgi:hypothetical protein
MGNLRGSETVETGSVAPPVRTSGVNRLRRYALLGVVAVALGTGATPPPAVPYGASPAAPAAAAGTASPMDEPLRLIGLARQSYQGLRDYTCLFVKREQLQGQLQPENLMAMKVRTQPFSVYLRWLAPKSEVGQEACYVAGRNGGMMRVHSTGLLGVAGFVSLDPRDPRAQRSSRHSITEAGIGNLIERFGGRWEIERRLNKTQVRIADYEYNKRLCTRVETIHPDNSGRQFYSYRSVIYFDKETHLPVRVEAYDWPRPGGDPAGDLLESYSYADLRFNVGLGNEAFNY